MKLLESEQLFQSTVHHSIGYFRTRRSDHQASTTCSSTQLKLAIRKYMMHQLYWNRMYMSYKGNRYQLYAWFSSMQVAREMHATPGNFICLEPLLSIYAARSVSISPMPINTASICSFIACPC